jgi:Domain of unknown function (DUF4280)
MAMQTVNSAQLMCTFGAAPSVLTVLPAHFTLASSQPSGNIMDMVPMENIMPFGMCLSPSNPQVAAATAAALGVLTPQPCIPVTTGPWAPGSPTVMIANQPALNNTSKCMCSWGGVISIVMPAQVTKMVP